MIFTHLLLLASQLQCNVIFGQSIRFHLPIMFESARGTVKILLLFEDYVQALLADCMPTVEIPRGFEIRIVELVTHWTFHFSF